VSVEGGGQPRWRSGTELFFLTLDANMTSTRVAAGKTFESAVPQKLFATGIPPLWFLHNNPIYDVTQDGQRFIMPVIPRDEYHAYIADELAGAGAEIDARWTTGTTSNGSRSASSPATDLTCCASLRAHLHFAPELIVEDAQVRNVLRHPHLSGRGRGEDGPKRCVGVQQSLEHPGDSNAPAV
jgi:hypothetical protein